MFIVRGLGTRKQKCKDVVVWVYVVGFGVRGPGFWTGTSKKHQCASDVLNSHAPDWHGAPFSYTRKECHNPYHKDPQKDCWKSRNPVSVGTHRGC